MGMYWTYWTVLLKGLVYPHAYKLSLDTLKEPFLVQKVKLSPAIYARLTSRENMYA